MSAFSQAGLGYGASFYTGVAGAGSGGTATATVSAGAVATVTVGVGGTLYAVAPTVVVAATSGDTVTTPAVVTATVASGIITAFTVVSGGVGYTHVPLITIIPVATYTNVAEISSITFGGFTVSKVDVTTLASPNSTQESIPGLLAPGTVEMTGNFTGVASQQTVTTLGQARSIFPWQITAPLGTGKTYTVTGNGFVSKLAKGPFKADSKIDFTVTLETTGTFEETVA